MDKQDVVLIYDTETTHNDASIAGVVQLGAVALYEDGHTETIMQTYCQPSVQCSPEALAVHGIGPDKYWLSPSEAAVVQQFKLIIDCLEEAGHRVFLGGFNSERFDNRVIDKIMPSAGFMNMPQLDPACVGPRLYPTHANHKLSTIHELFFPDEQSAAFRASAHDAVADCWMVAQMIHAFKEHYGMTLAQVSEWCSTPMVTQVCWFGKHKGTQWEFVPTSYTQFMADKFDDMSKDQVAILKHLGVRGRMLQW